MNNKKRKNMTIILGIFLALGTIFSLSGIGLTNGFSSSKSETEIKKEKTVETLEKQSTSPEE